MPPFPHPNLRSRSTADRVQHESIAALQTTTIKTGVGSVLIVNINMDMDIFDPSDVQSIMDRSKEKNNLIANTTDAPVYVCIAKDLQSGEKDGTLDLIKIASRKCRRRSSKTYVATVAIKLLNGLRSLPLTLEKDGRTTEDLERERSFVVVEIHDKSDRRVAKSSTDVRRENIHTRTKTGTFNCRRHPLKTTFNSNYGNKLDNDDRIKANQSRISDFFSLLERSGATGTLSLNGTELTIIYFLGIYKKCKCFWFIFLFFDISWL